MLFLAHSEPESIIELIPGFHKFSELMGLSFLGHAPVTGLNVVMSLIALCVLCVLIARSLGKFTPLPDGKLSARSFFEAVTDMLMSFLTEQLGREKAVKYLPLIGTVVLFIFLNNVLTLIPGLMPATDNLNTNVGMAVLIFFISNIAGIREHGIHYFAEFFGPVRKWYALPLMILMFPIEVVGQLARPMSLSIRLMGNMFGDHAVVGVLLMMFPFLLPLPMMCLGVLVIIIQTAVFSILSVVYISLAVAGHD